MNRKRVQHAIRVLNSVEKRKHRQAAFSLYSWAEFSTDEILVARTNKKPLRLNGCGYSGCAMGWIASSPKAIASGLRLTADPDTYGGFDVNIRYRGKTGNRFEAPAMYFGIGVDAAASLFSPTTYPYTERKNPKYVVRRLRELLKHGEGFIVENYSTVF